MARVSVIIPVFNSAALVGSALRSVFAQTYRDFDVTVVDDGSEDEQELKAVLAEWTGLIDYMRQPNGGPARARNTGIARSSGSLVAFLDADDEWLPAKLAAQVAYFEQYPQTGLLHTGVVGESPADLRAVPPRQAFCDLFHTTFFVNTLTVMIPRAVLQEAGGFDERREIHIEDWDLWLRIAAQHPFGYLPEPLAYHRPGGLMSSQIDRTYGAQALVIEKNKALCAVACAVHRRAPLLCEHARRYVLHRDWGYDRLLGGDRLGAREQLGRALTYAPRDTRTRLLYISTFASDRLRGLARRLLGARSPGDGAPDAPARKPLRAPVSAAPSLLHDTVYRRVRRRAIAALHDVDRALSSSRAGRKRILFEAASPMSFAVFKPVYERLRRDPRLELWFTANGEAWKPEEIFGPVGITERVITSSTAAWMKMDAYINTDLWDMTWLRRQSCRIHLFHGVAGKYGLDSPMDLAPAIAAFDCLMFANADRRRRYIESGLVAEEDTKAALVGFPKTDCLVDGTLDRTTILRELALDPAVPTVIYAPTWSPYSSLNEMGEEIIERLAAEGLQVLVKLHDRSYDPGPRGSGGLDWGVRLAKYHGSPLVRVIRDADGSRSLAASDAMVSDHSSIAFEYMLLDRPIVTIERPQLIEQAAISPDKVQKLRSAAGIVTDARAMQPAVVEALRQPMTLSAARRTVAGELFYRPGTATDRAVALIYQLIHLPARADAQAEVQSTRALAVFG